MAFFSTTSLGSRSPIFRGRSVELDRLVRLCCDEATRYGVLYGGRQNGKTSLLWQLQAALPLPIRVCRVDFQQIQGATPERVFSYLAARLRPVLPLGSGGAVGDGPGLHALLLSALSDPAIPQLVLLLDELGALPHASREALGHVLRALFDERLEQPALAKLRVVLSGGVELYNLILTEASSLHSVCDEIYLADLAEVEAVALLAEGLQGAGVDATLSAAIGRAVYAQVAGHPYLTQRMGELLLGYHAEVAALTLADVERAATTIRTSAPPLLRRIRSDLRTYKLEDAARRLFSDPPPFDRLDDDMARLELIGLAKPAGEQWAARNPLLAAVFRRQLGLPPQPAAPTPANAAPAPTPAPVNDEAPDTQPIITAKKRCLAALELTAARYGIDCPPHVTLEIEDLRRELADLERNTVPAKPAPAPTPEPIEPAPAKPAPAPPSPVSGPPSTVNRQSSIVHRPRSPVPELVHIPAGPFLMGSANRDKLAYDDEKPQHRLTLPDYWIGKTPVTNAQFRPFVQSDGYTSRVYWTEAGWQWREREKIIRPEYWNAATWNGDDYPVVGVSWFEAVAYCRWLSAQTGHPFCLPSEAEWEKAARGPEGLIWPWGNTWEEGRCNSEEAEVGQTTPVGKYPKGAGPYGALDMAGNVWEWCATKYGKRYPYALEDEWTEAYVEENTDRRIRGGAFWNDQKAVRGAFRSVDDPRYRNYYFFGLRVASHSPRSDAES